MCTPGLLRSPEKLKEKLNTLPSRSITPKIASADFLGPSE
jgi:hypothetical protein